MLPPELVRGALHGETRRPPLLAEDRGDSIGEVACARVDERSGDLRFLAETCLYRWVREEMVRGRGIAKGKDVLFRGFRPWEAAGALFAGSSVIAFEGPEKWARRIDLRTRRAKRLDLAHLRGCAALWGAWEAGDHRAAARILAFRERALRPGGPAGPIEVFDILVDRPEPVAAITSVGVYREGAAAIEPGGSTDGEPCEASPSIGVLLWELWIDHDEALPRAIDRLLTVENGPPPSAWSGRSFRRGTPVAGSGLRVPPGARAAADPGMAARRRPGAGPAPSDRRPGAGT